MNYNRSFGNFINNNFLRIRTTECLIMLVVSILMPSLGNSQANYEYKSRIIPPSPNSSSLGLYGDFPVSYYTGTPDITIPLYNIKTGDLELPISISYHASGIRVVQDASCVGLGWTLNAGGCNNQTSPW